MAATIRYLSDCIQIMRLAISRRNQNDPDSSDDTLFRYIQDFVALTMSDDLKIFEQWGTLKFTIDETNPTGVYTFNEVGAADNFVNITQEAFISLTDPPAGSVSWNRLLIYQDPGAFYGIWGVNNEDILIPGYPTSMLYYGTEMVFRTIPNTSYTVYIYGYKEVRQFSSEGDPVLPHAYWLRYIAYGAAMNYGYDYSFDDKKMAMLNRSFLHEKKLLLTRTHNQIKEVVGYPSF